MTNTKNTKRALLSSVLALFLCFAMLLGTTYAWFTDSVTSANNIIKSGTLNVEMYYADGSKAVPADNSTDWKNAQGVAIYTANQLWEPGYTDAKHIKISNEGTLALQYQLAIVPTGEVSKLAEVIDVYYIEDATQIATREDLASYTPIGTLDKLINDGIKRGNLSANTDYTATLVLKMQDTAENEYQDLSIGDDFTIQLLATQLTEESDSFDENYDKDSSAFVSSSADLKDAIANVKNGGTVYVNNGNYDISGQLNIAGKSVNIVGVGEDVVIRMTDKRVNYNKFFYIYGSADGEDVTVNISNVTLVADVATKSDIWIRTDAQNGAKVSGNVTVNLDNVTCTSIICDNNYVDGDIVNLNITNSKIEKVTLDASPFNGNGLNTYTNLMYSGSRIEHINIQNGAAQALNNITINGVHPTAIGEQQPLTYIDTAEELQDALDNAVDGDIIALGSDITGDVIVSQKEGVNITIDGQNYNYDGTIYVYGNSRNTGAEKLTIKNVNFVTDKTLDFISCNDGGNSVIRYAHNVTIEDCTFTNNGTGTVVPARFRQCYNITMKNCTVDGTFSVMWTTGVTGLTIDNVTANCTNEGLNVGTSSDVKVKNCNITVTGDYGFGVRADANGVRKLTVTGNTFTADASVVLRYATAAYTAELTGNTLNGDIIVTDSDYKNGVELKQATGDITVTIDGKIWVANATGLARVVNEGATEVNLFDGEYDVYGCGGQTLTINGTKDVVLTIVGTGSENGGQSDYGFDGSTVTFNGVTIRSNNNTYAGYVRMSGTYNNCHFENTYCLYKDSTFTECTFNISGDQYNIWTWGAPEATFNNCTFNSDGKALLLYGTANTKLTLNDCTFNDNGGLTALKAAVEIGNDYGKSYELIVNNATVNGYEINDKGINTGSTLWANKDSMGTDVLNVVIDGVDVY